MENSYYRLKDKNNIGVIIRTTGLAEHKYVFGVGWVEVGLLTHYFNDESDYYDLYEEITEAEALALTERAEA
jgi:hypothetical protein